jgi:arylsulfatase
MKSSETKQKQPNIVLIMADQLSAAFIQCYGSGVNSTPCLDSLAAEGTRFSRCYASAPVCAPNRACMLTGRSPEVHGIITNNYALQSDNPTYANVLKYHGYTCGGFGKFHQTPMSYATPLDLSYLGFDEVAVTEDPMWSTYIDWVRKNHPDCLEQALAVTNSHGGVVAPNYRAETKQGASDEDYRLKEEGFKKHLLPRMNASPWERMYESPLDAKADDCVYITDKGLDFMKRKKSSDQPFLCHLSCIGPHDPYDPSAPYSTMFSPQDMKEEIPAEWKNDPHASFFDGFRDNYLNFRKICEDKENIAKWRALYHGSIRMIDDQISRVVHFLKTEGLWEDTVIIFTTDHGDSMGDHGMISKGIHHYDTCIRTPLIVGGGYGEHIGDTDRLTATTDFFPTFCELASVPAENMPPIEGSSFAGFIRSGYEQNRHKSVNVCLSIASTVVSDDGWRMTVYDKSPARQLFYLPDDPTEQHNLYYDPKYNEIKIRLLEMLINNKARNTMLPAHYRNIPILHGRKIDPNRTDGPSLPLYCHSDAPWLEETDDKNLWRSKEN